SITHTPRTQRSTPFPYTTLFRSIDDAGVVGAIAELRIEPVDHLAVSLDKCVHPRFRHQYIVRRHTGLPGIHGLAEGDAFGSVVRSEEHTSELQLRENLVCRLLLE